VIVAADNLTSSNPVVAEALTKLDPRPLQELARRCEQAGGELSCVLANVLQSGLIDTARWIKKLGSQS